MPRGPVFVEWAYEESLSIPATGEAKLEAEAAGYDASTPASATRLSTLPGRLGVPVVDPAKAALEVAEALVSSGLRHSRRASPLPPKPRPAWSRNRTG